MSGTCESKKKGKKNEKNEVEVEVEVEEKERLKCESRRGHVGCLFGLGLFTR